MKRSTLQLCASVLGIAAISALAVSCGRSDTGSDVNEFSHSQLTGSDLPDKTIALTFDDGPGERTVELAKYLADQGIKATFFVIGNNAVGHEATLQTVHNLGHLIGNHTKSHQAMTHVSDPVEEVAFTDRIITPYITGNMFLFRAPYGDWAPHVADVLNSSGLDKYVGSVFWNMGGELTSRYSADWDCWGKGISVASCGQGYLNEIHDHGHGIPLMHDIHNKTVDMVKWLLPQLQAEGYSFVRLDAVPNIAKRLRDAGGVPGAGVEPLVLANDTCSAGYTLTKIGTQGGKACLDTRNMEGPFTKAMQKKCSSLGGGLTCSTNLWSRKFALSLRGIGICPTGATYDARTHYCVEGKEALGPFSQALQEKCENAGNSAESCAADRWDRAALAQLL